MQNNYEMIRMCILTFGLAGLSWEDMRKQQLHGWAILLLGISGMTISLLGGCWKNPVWFLGLLPGIFMLILAWSTRESIGYGDGLVILGMGCFYALGEIMGIVMIAITIAWSQSSLQHLIPAQHFTPSIECIVQTGICSPFFVIDMEL